VIDNADTWLDFTDLVFIDPPGTGYGRVLGDADVLGNLWSVDGDIEALTEVIRRWCETHDRLSSPKFLVGESYGGFRAPQIARKLQTDQGIGVSGMVLISPMLDIGQFWNPTSTMGLVASLPSMAAVARGRTAFPTPSDMRDVEDYASNAFLLDLMKGPNDREAVDRLTHKVADDTGLEFSVVEKLRGRVPASVFVRELRRAEGRVSSLLDGGETGIDAAPFAQSDTSDDQLFNGLYAPVTQAMINLYRHQLNWVVEGRQYKFLNVSAHNLWDYGKGLPETITELSQDLALDPSLRVLVATGIFDLDIPYYGTKLILDQIPDIGLNGRLQLRVYSAGHMIYARDEARKALREDVRKLFEGR
jgi:carboxypeptidase C (cathepsin A)